jgi:capsular exopolysaccharide synthesis family protein
MASPEDNTLPVPHAQDRAERTTLPVEVRSRPQQALIERPRGLVPQPAPALTSGALLRAFRHRWLLASFVGLVLGGAAGAAVWYFVPAKFTAYALLQVSDAEPQLIPDKSGPLIAPDERYFENTQVALIKSRPIVLAALRRPGIGELGIVRDQPDPALWLEEELKVGFLEKTNILRVALDGTNAGELATMVNAVKDAYLEQAVNAQRNKKLAMLDDLEKVYLASEEKMRSQRAALHQLAETLKSGDSQALSVKQKAILEEYVGLRKELTLLQAQLRTAEISLKVQKGGPEVADAPVPSFLIDQAIEADPMVVQKKIELAQFDSRMSRLSNVVDEEHPSRRKIEKERKILVGELDKLRADNRTLLTKQLRDRIRSEALAKSQQTQENVEVWRHQETMLKNEVDRIGKEAQHIGITSFELELKRGEIEQAEVVIRRLREERERLNVELQSTKQRITVIHSAEVPNRKNISAQARVIGMAGAFGLLLGGLSVCCWEARRRRIMNRDEVANELGSRIIGVIPWVEGAARTSDALTLSTKVGPAALLAESVDALRAQLLCETEASGRARVLMITSAVPREGKTTLAAHLALGLARAGRKTLLIDADCRRPALHEVFELSAGPGLSDVLRGETKVAAALCPGPVPALSILTAGNDSHHLSHAETMEPMRALLDGFRSEYEFVLVDSPPVLPVADTLFIGKRVDGVLLSIRPKLSRVPEVCAALERLASMHIPVMGTVVNGVSQRGSTYGYDYNYHPVTTTE